MIGKLLEVFQNLRDQGCPDPVKHMSNECDCGATDEAAGGKPLAKCGCGDGCGCGRECSCENN